MTGIEEMKPDKAWPERWKRGVRPVAEAKIGKGLLEIFLEFWDGEGLDGKSKTTRNRYASALDVLGAYIVDRAVQEGQWAKSAEELLNGLLEPDEGPLIAPDNEAWQREIDTVCRKLCRFRGGRANNSLQPTRPKRAGG